MKMIEVDKLTVSYGSFRAVDGVSFTVSAGEIVGFLGPNGAGKSTTLRVLSGFLGASSGRVAIAGIDVAEDSQGARAKIGYMPEMSPLYPEMRVGEYLRFRAELKKVPRGARKEAVATAMREARVDDFEDVMIGHLSKGYKQRVGLADALVASPPLLILDEPTAGLDPNQIREVRALIKKLGKDRTVLLSTHILSEVEATCSRAVVINRGRLVAEGAIDEVRAMRRPSGVRFVVRGDEEKALGVLRKAPGAKRVSVEEREGDGVAIHVELVAKADPSKLAEEAVIGLVGAKIAVREVSVNKASLEQVFASLTGNAASGADEGDDGAEGGDGAGRGSSARGDDAGEDEASGEDEANEEDGADEEGEA
ncbi:MAG: ATP-binding cassette domain-containing protein [Polyangiaceae bacterium]